MAKFAKVVRKTLKVILYGVIGFVVLVILLTLCLQIPFVQNMILRQATSYVQKKTHTTVEIENIRISFPRSVVVKGVYLEDSNTDTLLYAGKLKVSVVLRGLFRNKLHIKHIVLSEAVANLHRTDADSVFNYHFLLTAFSDTSRKPETKSSDPSALTVSIDKVFLKSISLLYDDAYAGVYARLNLGYLKLTAGKLDFGQSLYNLDDLSIRNMEASVLLTKPFPDDGSPPEGRLPKIAARTISIRNANVAYGDSLLHLSVAAFIQQLGVKNGAVDLELQKVLAGKAELSGSTVRYVSISPSERTDTPRQESNQPPEGNDWVVAVEDVALKDNHFEYTIANKRGVPGTFDVNHMEYDHLNLLATDIYYSSLKTEAVVKEFSAIDKNGYVIQDFQTEFSMDAHSISAKKLSLSTQLSAIQADISIRFPSLASVLDSPELVSVDLLLKHASITTSDLTYFSEQLSELPFFDRPMNVTTVSGRITGSLDNLRGRDIAMKTGHQTTLNANLSITGLPDIQKAQFDIPAAHVKTGKQDLEMFVGTFIPDHLEMPYQMDFLVNFKGGMESFDTRVNLRSSYGSANLVATLGNQDEFTASFETDHFDAGSLLKDASMYGPVSLTAEVAGQGLTLETVAARIKADVSQLYLNQYNYQNLKVNGRISGREFNGDITLKDPNASFDFSGLVNLNPDQERFQFRLNLIGANLQKLNLTTEDVRIGFHATADIMGGMDRVNAIRGTVGVSDFVLVRGAEVYALDSLLSISFNAAEKRRKERPEDPLIRVECAGVLSPFALVDEFMQFTRQYFSVSESPEPVYAREEFSDFTFSIHLQNHPVLYGMLLPSLKDIGPGTISGSFDARNNALVLDAEMQKITYESSEIHDLVMKISSDPVALHYKVSGSAVTSGQIVLENLMVEGRVQQNNLFVHLLSEDASKNKKIALRSQISVNAGQYTLVLDPDQFFLLNKRWDIAPDNSIEFGKEGFRIRNFSMRNADSEVKMASVHGRLNDDIVVEIRRFSLDDVSQVIEGDSSIVKGMADGDLLLKRIGENYGLIADASITNLFYHNIPIGDVVISADNPEHERFDIEVALSGADNEMKAAGYYTPGGGSQSLLIDVAIQSLSMKTIEAFSQGYISEADGFITGNLSVTGSIRVPVVVGEIVFNDAFLNPSVLNNRLALRRESLVLKEDGVYFNSFTLRDDYQNTAILDGSVKMKNFDDFFFDLHLTTDKFQFINTTVHDNQYYFGRMIIDSRIDINGTMILPVITGRVKLTEGSGFTVVVPESELNTDRGEGVVEFEDTVTATSLLYESVTNTEKIPVFSGFDLSVIVEIDQDATLKLLMDPTSKDSLVVRGDAALSFTIDRSGKISLTGGYNLVGGSYQVSLQSMLKRDFDIIPGSTIIWSGDPLNAGIDIKAKYEVRAAPYDLVATQITSMSATEQGSYKQRYPFWVIIHLRGEILHPVISFEIQLPPEEKGILGGAMNQKLVMLNEDESALNKQVFALLIMGRFIQENPLQTSSGGASMLVRTTVSNYISSQLNRLSAKALPGTELNFDVQSYDDYQTGEAQGRTEVELGIKKQLFKERLSIQVGGAVDVEGERARENSASEITSDVTVEYKLTKDGRYRLKGFRHNQYEGIIEGQLVESGVGFVYVLDFDRWKELFRAPVKKKDVYKKEDDDDSIPKP
ncbi:MAG: translocation/assembly module TamB domain-containing protein [Bacteroidales bacterium]